MLIFLLLLLMSRLLVMHGLMRGCCRREVGQHLGIL
jgi:hypothetical protein